MTDYMTDYEQRYKKALDAAEKVFESRDHAREWLNAPLYLFGGGKAVDLLQTDEGLRSVMSTLLSVEHGGVA
ncbi:MbcA/ParS/Xre antitoxin family protein [Pseudomonas sp.]|uniref:MbcA/ParS/Xre antitoxin family protein n=1 Tax=Pseudomonas sp. TaxID=306 RepID=UPI00272CBB00|nr:MbcA/ParS/Xre antitoxin family protein [Pseudomonas sp.]